MQLLTHSTETTTATTINSNTSCRWEFIHHHSYTTYRNNTSIQGKFKIGVPSPTLFNIYTAYLLPPRASDHVMAYADDITITYIHTSTSTTKKYIHMVVSEFLTVGLPCFQNIPMTSFQYGVSVDEGFPPKNLYPNVFQQQHNGAMTDNQ